MDYDERMLLVALADSLQTLLADTQWEFERDVKNLGLDDLRLTVAVREQAERALDQAHKVLNGGARCPAREPSDAPPSGSNAARRRATTPRA